MSLNVDFTDLKKKTGKFFSRLFYALGVLVTVASIIGFGITFFNKPTTKIYLVKGQEAILFDPESMKGIGIPESIEKIWPGLNLKNRKITASITQSAGKVYFFTDSTKIRYSHENSMNETESPIELKGEKVWIGCIDAACSYTNDQGYYFKGNEYVREDNRTINSGYPKGIDSFNWKGVWEDGVDAAVSINNKFLIMFKDDEYILFNKGSENPKNNMKAKPIKENLEGVWEDGIDAAVRMEIRTDFYIWLEDNFPSFITPCP